MPVVLLLVLTTQGDIRRLLNECLAGSEFLALILVSSAVWRLTWLPRWGRGVLRSGAERRREALEDLPVCFRSARPEEAYEHEEIYRFCLGLEEASSDHEEISEPYATGDWNEPGEHSPR